MSVKAAVEEWIVALRKEEALASVNYSPVEVDEWQTLHFAEDKASDKVKAAKEEYEDAVRDKFSGF